MVRRYILVMMMGSLLAVAACSNAPDSIPPTPAGAGGASAGKGGAGGTAGKGGGGAAGKAGNGDDAGVEADGGEE